MSMERYGYWKTCPVCWGRGRLGLFGQYRCYECDGAGEIWVGPEEDEFVDEFIEEEIEDVEEEEVAS